MIKTSEIEQIKKLIKDGFDIELLSFEFDIPMEKLKQYQEDLKKDKENIKTYSAKSLIDKKNKEIHVRVEKIRKRYNKLFLGNSEVNKTKTENLSKEDIKEINEVIKRIKKKVEELNNLSKDEKREIAQIILSELKKLEKYKLLIEQAEEVYNLIKTEELKKLNKNSTDKIDSEINMAKKRIAKQIATVIDEKCEELEDIEELKNLKRRLTSEIEKQNLIYTSSVKSRITNKIIQLQQQNARNMIKNDISKNIELIIADLISGNSDIQKANEIIEQEALKRVESKSKNKFTLTVEQEKIRILNQITTNLIEKADKYDIQNPETTVLQLQQLYGIKSEQPIRIVVKNLIGRKKFETARGICDKFLDKDIENAKYIKSLKNEIRNSEISDMVLTLIKTEDISEERAYMGVIQKGLEMGNIKLETVSLGKTKDGSRNITLADIWIAENQRENER